MPKYQVSLKQGSKNVTNYLEAKSLNDLLAFYEKVSTMKVIKVMEIVYQAGKPIPIDDFNYHGLYKGIISNDAHVKQQIMVNNVKKTINTNEMVAAIKTHLEVNNLSVDGVITNLFKMS